MPFRLCIIACGFLGGCAAIRTPGTEGLSSDALAEVFIPRHDGAVARDGKEVHVSSVTLYPSGHERVPLHPSYPIRGSGETLLLLPGEHRLVLEYDACQHWPNTWLRPFYGLFTGLTGSAHVKVEAGHAYLLRSASAGWQSGPVRRYWLEEAP